MDVKMIFNNGSCELIIKPINHWEKALLGAIAKGGDCLDAKVKYKPEGHFTHGNAEAVEIILMGPVE